MARFLPYGEGRASPSQHVPGTPYLHRNAPTAASPVPSPSTRGRYQTAAMPSPYRGQLVPRTPRPWTPAGVTPAFPWNLSSTPTAPRDPTYEQVVPESPDVPLVNAALPTTPHSVNITLPTIPHGANGTLPTTPHGANGTLPLLPDHHGNKVHNRSQVQGQRMEELYARQKLTQRRTFTALSRKCSFVKQRQSNKTLQPGAGANGEELQHRTGADDGNITQRLYLFSGENIFD